MISRAPLSLDGFMHASNYINKRGEHPKVLSAIVHWEIVLKKEDLNDDNWLYIGTEPEDKIKWQLSMLRSLRDFVAIVYE
jgi:hypothetical protein